MQKDNKVEAFFIMQSIQNLVKSAKTSYDVFKNQFDTVLSSKKTEEFLIPTRPEKITKIKHY